MVHYFFERGEVNPAEQKRLEKMMQAEPSG